LITISDEFTIKLSPKFGLREGSAWKSMLLDFDGAHIRLPDHFLPSQAFLQYHREHKFKH
jgi:hypothetical protein